MRIDEALLDCNLLGAGLGDPEPWGNWLAIHRAANGERLSEGDAAFFASVSGGREAPREPVKELVIVAGRRSGKSRQSGALAVEAACLREHELAPGETGYILVLSATVAQAKQIFQYALGFLEASPLLRGMIRPRSSSTLDGVTSSEIRLTNNVVIAVHPNSYKSVRGRTILCCIFDETAFWEDADSQNPALEVWRAVRPSLMAAGGRLVMISSPYRKAGLLYERYKEFFGKSDPHVLVIQGPSIAFNPTLDPAEIARDTADDPEAARAEWHGQFRDDISSFLDDRLIAAAVDKGRPVELPPRQGISYAAFVDASGGRSDAYVVAIGHKDGGRVVVDCLRGYQPPFNPATVTAELAFLCRKYRIDRVTGDNYSAEWVASAWAGQGMDYTVCGMSASGLYVELVPVFAQERMNVPDMPVLIRELRNLERRTSRTGRDTIGHPQGQHDDHANAVAGLVQLLENVRQPGRLITKFMKGPSSEQLAGFYNGLDTVLKQGFK
jgi:hypothetical protein